MHAHSACRKPPPEKTGLDPAGHLPVGNAGIRKFIAMRNKAVTLIEPDGMRLCIEVQCLIAATARILHQKIQNDAADAASAPFAQDRHPSDMPVRQQSSGTDRLPSGILRQRMHRDRIKFVPLQ